MDVEPPCRCGCRREGEPAHRVVAFLASGDVDRALEAGLLECRSCEACDRDCTALLEQARDARRQALDARERYRTRAARLARRRQEREQRRALPSAHVAGTVPALPPAAAAALARAKARAAGRDQE